MREKGRTGSGAQAGRDEEGPALSGIISKAVEGALAARKERES